MPRRFLLFLALATLALAVFDSQLGTGTSASYMCSSYAKAVLFKAPVLEDGDRIQITSIRMPSDAANELLSMTYMRVAMDAAKTDINYKRFFVTADGKFFNVDAATEYNQFNNQDNKELNPVNINTYGTIAGSTLNLTRTGNELIGATSVNNFASTVKAPFLPADFVYLCVNAQFAALRLIKKGWDKPRALEYLSSVKWGPLDVRKILRVFPRSLFEFENTSKMSVHLLPQLTAQKTLSFVACFKIPNPAIDFWVIWGEFPMQPLSSQNVHFAYQFSQDGVRFYERLNGVGTLQAHFAPLEVAASKVCVANHRSSNFKSAKPVFTINLYRGKGIEAKTYTSVHDDLLLEGQGIGFLSKGSERPPVISQVMYQKANNTIDVSRYQRGDRYFNHINSKFAGNFFGSFMSVTSGNN